MFENQVAFLAVCAPGGIDAGECMEEVLPGRWRGFGRGRGRWGMEEIAASREGRYSVSVGKDAVVSDFDETGGEDVEEETSDELEGGQGHGAGEVALFRISVPEGDLVCLESDNSAVGDGAAVGVCAEVSYDVLWPPEWGLAVDVPVDPVEAGQEGAEGG